MQPLISVVIPVYNVEKYLKQCLDSVINQTLKNIEIICIDDGSTDKSLYILKEYSKKDARIIVLQQNNLHAGVARNSGLKIAKADYIIFLDSDDFFELDMLENMYNSIIKDNSDAAICGFYKYNNKTKKIKNRSILETFVKKSPFCPLDLNIDTFNFTNPAPWTKLFKKSVFLENQIVFEDYISCNDLTCMILALACCKKVSVLDKCYVYYRANQDTNLTANRNRHVKYVLYALEKAKEELQRLNLYNKCKIAFLRKVKNTLKYELSLCSKEEREKALIEGKDILSDTLYQILYELIYVPKISIIIPVYNNEQYLNRCLESVIYQNYNNIEIICVNDCSTDNSLDIIKQYSEKDDRIKIIDLVKNCGVSNARNIGLNNISGDYVAFLDSDDFLDLNFCNELYSSLIKNNSDLACGGHTRVNILDKKLKPWLPSEEFSKSVNEDIYLFTKHRNVTQKLFKTSIIKNNNISFSTTLNYMEDALFLVIYLSYCKCISGVKKSLYYVQINPKSLCRNIDLIDRREKDKEIALLEINKIILNKKS